MSELPEGVSMGQMSEGCCHLGEMTEATIRLYCPECFRFAHFKRTKLLERFSSNKPMPTMLRDLKPVISVTRCPGRNANWAIGIA